jgi:predicted TIM-barrel fold metal-dependent hydrolase
VLPECWDSHVHVFDATQPVLAGHYTPATHSLQDIEAHAAPHGVQRLVLVQPSVYGANNRVLLHALAQTPGRHRGVVVLDANTAGVDWASLHAAGVRGVRFNLVSPLSVSAAGLAGSPLQAAQHTLQALLPHLQRMRWHVQWYVHAHQLPALAALLPVAAGVPFVFDHLAGLTPQVRQHDPAWQALASLAQAGAWVKLSGWYRLRSQSQTQVPFEDLLPIIDRVATLFGPRLVWGSDWPHTGQPAAWLQAQGYANTWAPVVAALGEAAALHTRQQGPALLYA